MTPEAIAYDKHKNLKIAADEIGIKWQTLYYRLKTQGIKVVGDKSRYGSTKDKLAAFAESQFKLLVPKSIDMNLIKCQSKFDFLVNGLKVDVKASMKNKYLFRSESKRWAFSLKKQNMVCDFACCFCLDDERKTEKVILIPKEFFKGLQTISIATSGNSKWLDYEVSANDLNNFFEELDLCKQDSNH